MAKFRFEERLTLTQDWPDVIGRINAFAEEKRKQGYFVRVLETTELVTVSAVLQKSWEADMRGEKT